MVFIKTLTGDCHYPLHYCRNLQLPIQMQLSEKRKFFSEFPVPFLESTLNYKKFEKKDDGLSECVFEIPDCEKHPYTTL